MQRTDQRLLTVSMPTLQWFDGEWRIEDETLRGELHRLLVTAYERALPSFDRAKLASYPSGQTTVFAGWMGGQLVSTAAMKVATDKRGLDRLLETSIPELERAMVAHALQVLLDTPLREQEAALRRLEAIVDRRALVRLIQAKGDRLDGLGAQLEFPIAVFARAGNAPGFHGLNQSMRLAMLEVAWRMGCRTQAGLNAERSGLPKRLQDLGYWTFPVTQARAIFDGPQRVSWLTRGQFQRGAARLRDAQRAGRIPAIQWEREAGGKLALMGGEPW